MKFYNNTNANQSVEFAEEISGNVRCTLKTPYENMVLSGTVDFDEQHLRELRKWITIQIREMKIKSVKPSNHTDKISMR